MNRWNPTNVHHWGLWPSEMPLDGLDDDLSPDGVTVVGIVALDDLQADIAEELFGYRPAAAIVHESVKYGCRALWFQSADLAADLWAAIRASLNPGR